MSAYPTNLEAVLEARFRSVVRRQLLGMVVKLAPTEVGVPDRMVLLPGGQIFLVELKTRTGVLSPKQAHWHDEAKCRGTKVVVLYGEADQDAWVRKQREWIRENV